MVLGVDLVPSEGFVLVLVLGEVLILGKVSVSERCLVGNGETPGFKGQAAEARLCRPGCRGCRGQTVEAMLWRSDCRDWAVESEPCVEPQVQH